MPSSLYRRCGAPLWCRLCRRRDLGEAAAGRVCPHPGRMPFEQLRLAHPNRNETGIPHVHVTDEDVKLYDVAADMASFDTNMTYAARIWIGFSS